MDVAKGIRKAVGELRAKATPTEGGKHFIIGLKVGRRNSQAAMRSLTAWRCVVSW